MDYRVPDEHEAHLSDSPITRNGMHTTIVMFTHSMAHALALPNSQYQSRAGEMENQSSGYGYWANYRSGELDGRLLGMVRLFQRESPITHPLTLLNF